jgi:hypothetical protein
VTEFQFIGVPSRMQICASGIAGGKNLCGFRPLSAHLCPENRLCFHNGSQIRPATILFMAADQSFAAAIPAAHDATRKFQRRNA